MMMMMMTMIIHDPCLTCPRSSAVHSPALDFLASGDGAVDIEARCAAARSLQNRGAPVRLCPASPALGTDGGALSRRGGRVLELFRGSSRSSEPLCDRILCAFAFRGSFTHSRISGLVTDCRTVSLPRNRPERGIIMVVAVRRNDLRWNPSYGSNLTSSDEI
jgi:hypothetical protein